MVRGQSSVDVHIGARLQTIFKGFQLTTNDGRLTTDDRQRTKNMPDTSDSAWWDFAIDPATRSDPDAARLKDETGAPLVNPADPEGRRALDYPAYLGLDRLLDAQTPASRVPEERMFVILHQLFELVFKQMTFDLAVVARTFEELLAQGDDAFRSAALEPVPGERGPDPFWRPAMTAAARLRHSARRVLPTVMSYVGHGEDDDVLFSTLEYALFRDFLMPASGFQTAQLRLIQRALGKAPLLRVRVYPGAVYGEHYSGCPSGHVSLGDPLILRAGLDRAFPGEDQPPAVVARLDDLAHAVMARLADQAQGLPDPPSIRTIHDEDVSRAVARFRTTLGEQHDADEVTGAFGDDLHAAAREENQRREGFGTARLGAQALHARHSQTCTAFVLDRIAATDAALHAPDPDSFLTVHRKAVRRHVADESGTGGGGMPYLVTSQRFLLPLFPALVGYIDLGMAGSGDDRERW
jgi:tryptophan 2,3-dioxygenase